MFAPTAQLTATPTVISAGDQAQLSWRTTNATSISIDGIGDVPSVGREDGDSGDIDHLSPGGAGRRRLGRRYGAGDGE